MATTFTVLPLRIVDVGGAVVVVGASSVVGAAAEIPLMHRSAVAGPPVRGARRCCSAGAVRGRVVLYGTVPRPGAWCASAVRGAATPWSTSGSWPRSAPRSRPERQARGQAWLQTVLMGVAPVAGASLGGFGYTHLAPPLLFGIAAAAVALGAATASSRFASPTRVEGPDNASAYAP